MKKLLSILLVLAMLVSMLPAGFAEDIEIVEFDEAEEDELITIIDPEADTDQDAEANGAWTALDVKTATTEQIRNRLAEIKAQMDGRYWNNARRSFASCKTDIKNGRYIDSTTTSKCKCSRDAHDSPHYNASSACKSNTFNDSGGWAEQCFGFANYLYYALFGTVRSVDGVNLKAYSSSGASSITELKPGDIINQSNNPKGTGTHRYMVWYVDGDNLYVADCNRGENCIIRFDKYFMSASKVLSRIKNGTDTLNRPACNEANNVRERLNDVQKNYPAGTTYTNQCYRFVSEVVFPAVFGSGFSVAYLGHIPDASKNTVMIGRLCDDTLSWSFDGSTHPRQIDKTHSMENTLYGTITVENFKNLMKYAWPGDILQVAFKRESDSAHTMVIDSVTDTGLTLYQANYKKNTVTLDTVTWNYFINTMMTYNGVAAKYVTITLYRGKNYEEINGGPGGPEFPGFTVSNQYTFTFHGNGGAGTMSSFTLTDGERRTLEPNAFTRVGYHFEGWHAKRKADQTWFVSRKGWMSQKEIEDKGYTMALYADKASITMNNSWRAGLEGVSNYGFYAVWKANEYPFVYHSNGGSGSMSSFSVSYGEAFSLPQNTFTKTGYSFEGWNIKREADQKWYVKGEGWKSESEIEEGGFSKAVYDDGSAWTMGKAWIADCEDVSEYGLYAIWGERVYTFSYNANGGTGSMSGFTVPYGESFTLEENTFVKAGSTFAGWNVKRKADSKWYVRGEGWKSEAEINDGGFSKAVYDDGSSWTMSKTWVEGYEGVSEYILYAVWKDAASVFAYHPNGGVGAMDSFTLTSGEQHTLEPNSFTRQGYEFAGWNVKRKGDGTWYVGRQGWLTQEEIADKGYSKAVYADQATITLSQSWRTGYDGISNYGFFAVWKESVYPFSYHSNGGTGSMNGFSVSYGKGFTLDQNTFVRDGYSFAGWNIKREADSTWYVRGQGWLSESEIRDGGYSKAVYADGSSWTMSQSWIAGYDGVSEYGLYAIWTKNDVPVQTDAAIVVGKATGLAGGTVDISVSLENNPGIISAMLHVSYDSNALILTGVTDDGKLGTPYHNTNYNLNPYILSWANDTATEDVTYNGRIVVLHFQIKNSATEGNYPISVSYNKDELDIFNSAFQPVEFMPVQGSVTVQKSEVLLGDVSGDGKINGIDRTFLARHIAQWNGYSADDIVYAAADVDGNGKVNGIDRTVLARYIAQWPGYGELPYHPTSSAPINAKHIVLYDLMTADEATIVAATASAKAGESVDITISLENNPGLISMLLHVGYDASALELTGFTDAGKLGAQYHNTDYTKNPYILSWADDTATADNTYNGVIVTLHFKVKAGVAPGSYPITLSYSEDDYDIYNSAFESVYFELRAGNVTVEGSGEIVAPVPCLDGMSTAGIQLGWAAIDGMETVETQRKLGSGAWETVKTTDALGFVDGDVQMGQTYSYRVRAYVNGAWTDYSEPLTVFFNPFSDVSGKKTIEYVAWAFNNGIVNGTSTTKFSPDNPCTRIQFVMMLWKMHGSPVVGGKNPFSDISGKKTTNAILWALDQGIINSGKKFDPDGNITRVNIVMMLWKLAGSPNVTGDNPFTDVSGAKTTKAVLWAYQNGITKGTSSTKFSPDKDCTRVQLVVFLYKYNGIYHVI